MGVQRMGISAHLPQQALGAGLRRLRHDGVGFEINGQNAGVFDDQKVDHAVNASSFQRIQMCSDRNFGQGIGSKQGGQIRGGQNAGDFG